DGALVNVVALRGGIVSGELVPAPGYFRAGLYARQYQHRIDGLGALRKGPRDVPRSLLLGRDGRAHDGNWNRYAAGRPARLVLIVPDQAAAGEGDGGQEQGQENCDGTKAGRRGSKAQQTTHTIGSGPCRHKWKTTASLS